MIITLSLTPAGWTATFKGVGSMPQGIAMRGDVGVPFGLGGLERLMGVDGCVAAFDLELVEIAPAMVSWQGAVAACCSRRCLLACGAVCLEQP